MASDIEQKVEKFLSLANGDPHHSNYSWDHCYLFFRKFRKLESTEQKNQIDLACLNLGFYLASWGMYRGSTFVRWKDYKIYTDVIKKLTREEFKDLWEPNYYDDLLNGENEINGNNEKIKTLFTLKEEIKKSLEPHTAITKFNEKKRLNVTDTLITKILLGTMGCVPAYDSNFRKGLWVKEISPHNGFNKKSFVKVLKFCKVNYGKLTELKVQIPNLPNYYALMKIVDMYFLTVGIEENNKK